MLCDLAVLQDQDGVNEGEGREPVGHDDAGAACQQAAKGAVDQALRGGV